MGWAFFAFITFSKAGWHAHWNYEKKLEEARKATQSEARETSGTTTDVTNADGTVTFVVAPRKAWNKMNEEDADKVRKEILNDMVYDVSKADVDYEMKRKATFLPGTGVYGMANTDFGEALPKLKNFQKGLNHKLTDGVDTVRSKLNKKHSTMERTSKTDV